MTNTFSSDKTNNYYFYGKSKTLPHPSGKAGKKVSGYHYRCYQENRNNLVFSSFNYRKGHAGSIFLEGNEGATPHYILKLRKSFPISGKIDLIDTDSENSIGTVTRGHKVFNSEDDLICRYSDTRSWREHLGEGVVDAIGNLLIGDGNTAPPNDGAYQFVMLVKKEPVGVLSKEKLPFFIDPPQNSEPGKTAKLLKKVLPKTLGSGLFDASPPLGWRFSISKTLPQQNILMLAGALMTIEIRRW